METVDKLIWREMVQAKSWEQYVSEYIGDRIDRKKLFSIIAISLAIIGGSTWSLWRVLNVEWITPLMFGLMGIAQVLSAIQKEIVITPENLQSLHNLRGMYISYFNQLERLYLSVESGKSSLEKREETFYALRETTLPIESLKDSINIKNIKKINKKIEERIKNGYLKDIYGIKDHPNCQ